MIPIKLSLSNFMCYGKEETLLDFQGFHLACLTGNNGEGKSALLDALTWALWGKARQSSSDELIRLGEEEMRVEYIFSLEENIYRVRRMRSRKGKGWTGLELGIAQEKGERESIKDIAFRSLSSGSIRETEKRIEQILRMDYETFINSSYLLQGRADEFTLKSPLQRKAILGQILGLTIYEQLENIARQHCKELDYQLENLKSSIMQVREEMGNKEEYKKEIEKIRERLSFIKQEENKDIALLTHLRRQEGSLSVRQESLQHKNKELLQHKSRTENLANKIKEAEKKKENCQQVFAQKSVIEEGFNKLNALRKRDEEFNAGFRKRAALLQERHKLEEGVREERHNIEKRFQGYLVRQEDIKKRAQLFVSSIPEMERIKKELENAQIWRKEEEIKERQRLKLEEKIKALGEEGRKLQEERKEIEHKLSLLEKAAEPVCPLCKQKLTQEKKEGMSLQFQKELKQCDDEFLSRNREREGLIPQLSGLSREILEIKEKGRQLAFYERELARYQVQEKEVKRQEQDLGEIEKQIEETKKMLAQKRYAINLQQSLETLDREIKQIDYQEEGHNQVRKQIGEYLSFEKKKRELEESERIYLEINAGLEEWKEERRQEEERMGELKKEQMELDNALKELPSIRASLEKTEASLEEKKEKESIVGQELGDLEGKYKYCLQMEKQYSENIKKRKTLTGEMDIYEKLSRIFSKRGIQSFIIENALPEIEKEANALLDRLSEGRMQLTLKAFKEVKTKKEAVKKGVETLEIKIRDEMGIRNYELFSGGEAFRINFALRIALSKLLVDRSGARLQTLIIDEGFGSQDAEGRAHLIEAIKVVKEDFQKILVISHLEGIQELFPAKIIVSKDPIKGSRITIST